jgi:diacylglycerol kinase family enzyme
MLTDIPSEIVRTPKSYAVLLNSRAKRWTGALHEQIRRWVPAKDLYLTDDFRQAEQTVDRLCQSKYEAIFTGGGDGTIMYLINAVEQRIQAGLIDRESAPPVGVLKMGTGNALASYLGCQDIIGDLRALRAGAPIIVYGLHLLESAGIRCPFAGFGWDAEILNDYEDLKESVRSTALENYVTGLGGYALSVLSRSVPRAMRRRPTAVRIRARSAAAEELDRFGHTIKEFPAGEIVYEGPAQVIGASAIPNWGFNIQMFPYAMQRNEQFEIRIFNGSVGSILGHLPSWWQGKLDPGDYRDFVASDVDVEVLRAPMAYQVAGDPKGLTEKIVWQTTEIPVPLAVAMS